MEPAKPNPAPLIPLPIVIVPFERIGMDLVRPPPKSAKGHEYILVIVNYATRCSTLVLLKCDMCRLLQMKQDST